MDLFDPRILQMLTFLTRHQAWLSPYEISRTFHPDGSDTTARTIHRWFHFLREHGSFVYYPYPKANALGLQDVLVRIHDTRNPGILGLLPFAASFNVEVGLGTGEPFVSQGDWVPGEAMEDFREYWRAARDLGLVGEVEVFPARNTHFVYSPFERLIQGNGDAELRGPVDNGHFHALLRRNLRGKFEVRVGERVAKSPLIIPIVVEHIWAHFSSRQVWQAIREAGEARLRPFAKGAMAHALDRPGAALRLLQQQWTDLVRDYDEVFLQPRVLFDWTAVRKSMWISLVLRTGSTEKMIEAAVQASRLSILTQLKPGVEFDERCHILCWLPSEQLPSLLKVVRAFHQGFDPPTVAVQDKEATMALFQPSFCKVDWRLFDPATLSWGFDEDVYAEKLKALAQDPRAVR